MSMEGIKSISNYDCDHYGIEMFYFIHNVQSNILRLKYELSESLPMAMLSDQWCLPKRGIIILDSDKSENLDILLVSRLFLCFELLI